MPASQRKNRPDLRVARSSKRETSVNGTIPLGLLDISDSHPVVRFDGRRDK